MSPRDGKYNKPWVITVKDRCRVCYTCVRECPAKAIRISDGQAEVIPERCIGCGNCVRVCSQKAKQAVSSLEEVRSLLSSGDRVAACIAPSFAADFHEMPPEKLVGMLKALGFSIVSEVGFGADLVAREMARLFHENPDKRYIASSCPAVFGYIKRYQPSLIDSLAPVVSPMIAEARVLRQIHGEELRVVFIGPCIAKKGEAYSHEVMGEIDEVLTFSETRHLLEEAGIDQHNVSPSGFDPPRAGRGTLFPIQRGLLDAANIDEDLATGEVISADGRGEFIDALNEFESGDMEARLLDVLCCNGCIMGAGMATEAPLFRRRARVSAYARDAIETADAEQWKKDLKTFETLDLRRKFFMYDQRLPAPEESAIKEILARMGKFYRIDELNCGACGYETCRDHAVAIHKGLAESEMCLPYTIEKMNRTIRELNVSNDKLASAREALIQSEKMASMGQLAAGIAHEVNNPLGVVLMYAHLLADDVEDDPDTEESLKMIVDHADRAKKIVAGLLHFARQNKVTLEEVDVTELIEDSLKAVTIPTGIMVKRINHLENASAELDHDQMVQVLTNLFSNAVTAMKEKGVLTVETDMEKTMLRIRVTDTGAGIPEENRKKIFEPFFTTKEIGKGTGLGLAVSYGIIKMHRGNITVTSNTHSDQGPTGTTFTIKLPVKTKE